MKSVVALLFALLCLSGSFRTASADDTCSTAQTSFFTEAAKYVSSYYEFEDICEGGGLDAVKSCYDQGYFCYYYAYHYYDAASEFMVDIPELASCVDMISDCTMTSTTFSDSCYDCERNVLYFVDAIVDGTVTFDRDCSDSSRADCYEYDAFQSCTNATSECSTGWDSQCISYRDLVWITMYDSCSASTSYLSSCDSSTVTDYCDNLSGDESYSQTQCQTYTSQLEYCTTIEELFSDESTTETSVSSMLEGMKHDVNSIRSAKMRQFTNCLDNVNALPQSVHTSTLAIEPTKVISFIEVLGNAGLYVGFSAGSVLGVFLGLFGASRFLKRQQFTRV